MTESHVYISYSHDSPNHKAWVRRLAEKLRQDGVSVILDQWDLKPGDDIRRWQEQAIQRSDAILVVMTQKYLDRSVSFDTGVGLDRNLLEHRPDDQRLQIIPIVPPGSDFSPHWPSYLSNRFGLQIADEIDSSEEYSQLLAALRGTQRLPTRQSTATRKVRGLKHGDASPVILRRLQLQHFRRIDSLDLIRDAARNESSHGQWTLLLGDNGVGKSSILWSLALALVDQEQSNGVLALLSSPLVRGEAGECMATVHIGADEFRFDVRTTKPRRERLNKCDHAAEFMVFAYGSARGSAFGGPDRAVELDRPLDAVGTLFGLGTHLIHADTWLRGLEHSALKGKRSSKASQVFETVRETLIRILPGVEEIIVAADQVRLRGPSVGDCSLAALSDGYASTLGWVVDLMARWVHEQQQREQEIKPQFNETMTGLVLIDELDLHLHPRWQTRVVDDLRQAFPKLSFVATTHNPLTLLGAKPGEVHVLRQNDGQVEVSQIDLPPGIRADQVLTGSWFGLSSTLDAETQKLLDKHRALLRKGTAQTDPKRLDLEHKLRIRLGSYADTSDDRMAQELVARELSKSHERITPEERGLLSKKLQKVLATKK